jgi:integrase
VPRLPEAEDPWPDERLWPRLLEAAGDSPTPWRDRALLHLFWHAGLRVPDALGLALGDVDFLSGRVRWGAGQEARLPPEALAALTAYVSLERRGRPGWLFADRRGRPLGRPAVARLFRRLARASGVPVTPEALRLRALERLLGRDPLAALAAVRGAARGA